jgi:hypothetical protein
MEMEKVEQKKKLIAESVLVSHLNQTLIEQHKKFFLFKYKLEQLLKGLNQQRHDISASFEVRELYDQVVNFSEKNNYAYNDAREADMVKFRGEGGGDGQSSSRSSKPAGTERSELSSARVGSAGKKDDDGELEEEEELDEEYKTEAQKADELKRLLYKDHKSGAPYDPSKKFGVIDAEGALIYDDITTSYPLNLPAEYYHGYIKSQLPKEDGEKWFIRPHHIENLTQHKSSIRDAVLNTHYFSHYNKNYGKKVEKSEAELALEHI